MTIEYIPAGEFKTHCLKLISEVCNGKRTIIVTKHGKQMVKIMPVKTPKKAKKLKAGFMKGSIKITGDIVSPNHEAWDIDNWKFPY